MKKTLLFLFSLLLAAGVSAQTAFSEDFESVTTGNGGIGPLPTGWTSKADAQTNTSNYSAFGQSWSVGNLGDNKAAVSTSYTTQRQPVNRWMVTPAIQMDANTGYYLTFRASSASSSYTEKLRVWVSTTDTAVASFTMLQNITSVPGEWTNYAIDLTNYRGQNIYIGFQLYSTDCYYIMLDDVFVGSVADNEMTITAVNLKPQCRRSESFDVKGVVMNKGLSPLTSYDVTYNVDGGANVATYHVSGINVSYGATTRFTHNVPASIADLGEHIITVTVSNPNGSQDNTADNTLSDTMKVVVSPRTTLLEHFTTARCGNCPAFHRKLDEATEGRSDIIWVSHHVGYYTDDLTIDPSQQMLTFYNDGGSTYAPAMMLDRTRFNTSEPGPVFLPGSVDVITSYFDRAVAETAGLDLGFSRIEYNPSSRQLRVTVEGQFTSNLTFDSPRLNVWIVEDSIILSQSGASGTYYHSHVIRAMLTDTWGATDAITSTTSGSTFSKTYTYTFPEGHVFARSRVVAFVSNYASNVNNRKVMNACQSANIRAGAGIREVGNAPQVTVYPNPAANFVVLETSEDIQQVQVVNMMGQVVYNNDNVAADHLMLNTAGYAAGIYMVTVKTANGSTSQRLSIVR